MVTCDVLVVGAGAGGLMAAISSASTGSDVVLCEKGNARRSGGIAAGNDHFQVIIPGIHSESFRSSVIREAMGRGIADEDTVTQYVDRSHEVLQMWESWGIDMKRGESYEFAGHSLPGTTGYDGGSGKTDRLFLHFSDADQCVKLERQAKKRGVRIFNRTMITELLKGPDGRIEGAIGVSTREPTLYVFQAKSTIVNKGGVSPARLYPNPNVRGYSMAEPGTGDGVMAAYRAGARLHNAEFFRRQISLRFGPSSGKGTWIGVTRDDKGDPIAPPYLSEPVRELGDKAIENADAVDRAWATGRAPVWMDPRGISPADEEYMRWGFNSEAMQAFVRWADAQSVSLRKTRFEFHGMQPGSSMQLRFDRDHRASLEGLYAIGQGGLSHSAVGGLIAGESAGKDARNAAHRELEESREQITRAKAWYEELLEREGPQYAGWREAQWAVWQTMHCYAQPPQRTEGTLTAGHSQLLRVRDLATKTLGAGDPHDLCRCLEVLNLMEAAELVLLAVKERRESRGQALRQDYPCLNPLLNKHLIIEKRDDSPAFSWERPRRLR